jgi:hypothetical protein
MQKNSGHVAKFMPRFDGPFVITCANPSKPAYTLELPNEPKRFPTFHTSLLHKFVPNNDNLFLSRKLVQPGPVVTENGCEEWLIEWILDEHVRGRGRQYLVRWQGWG